MMRQEQYSTQINVHEAKNTLNNSVYRKKNQQPTSDQKKRPSQIFGKKIQKTSLAKIHDKDTTFPIFP